MKNRYSTILALALLALGLTTAQPAPAAVIEAWVQRYNGPSNSTDQARAVAVDGSGNVVVTGYSNNGTNDDYYTAKYAASGILLWEKRYNGPANTNDQAQAVAVDGSGNVIVTGYSHNGPNDDYYTAKYAAADGALLWEKRYNSPLNSTDQAQAVAVDGSGNAVVTGRSVVFGYDYYTAKYAAANGALLWEKRYNNFPANNDDAASAVAVDDSGNVVVTGESNGEYYTAKYAAADGALLWEKGYDRAGIGDFANAVSVDGDGNVVVTGYSLLPSPFPFFPSSDYYTAKYAAADGALLWEEIYDSGNHPNFNDDQAQAVAVDGSGNVVVTGSSRKGPPNYDTDFYTIKYAAADGALLWEKRYDGPTTNSDFASAVAIDSSGNVVVTGYSSNGTNNDYYTAKYAAADGALLWEKSYNGPANGNDTVNTSRSLALGPNDMVVITGSSIGSGGNYDYATVVYREPLSPVSIALVPTGVRLRFDGVPGRTYEVQRALEVTGPWPTIATPIAPMDGLIEYIDTTPPPGMAFYRTFLP